MSSVPDVGPLSGLLKALADETRLRLVALLAHGELCVCHLEGALGAAQPTVSRHLAVLRHAGVVRARREGTWVYYTLAEPADAAAGRVMRAIVSEFADAPTLARDLARLRAVKGPGACP